MILHIDVHFDGVIYRFGLLNGCTYCRLKLPNVFVIDAFKSHNHSYYFKAFFYNSEMIYSTSYYNTKTELYRAIQKLLKDELHHV